MKRILFKICMTVIFVMLLAFALKNTDTVAVRYFLGFEWHTPLINVLFAFFAFGAVTGIVANLTIIGRQRREILALKRDLRRHARAAATPMTATAESL